MRPLSALGWIALLGAALGAGPERSAGPAPPSLAPRAWIWAWERPEDLRFLGGRPDVGVAVLARTVTVGDAGVVVHRRAQPALLAEGTPRAAVVRVELLRGSSRFEAHGRALAEAILEGARDVPGDLLQIDFDAPPRAWPLYREVLAEVRRGVRPGMVVSITAIAAWCARAVPVVEPDDDVLVVPMLFAMGADAPRVHLALAARGDFADPRCRRALGVMAGEARPRLPQRPIWIFSRRALGPADLSALTPAEDP